MVGPFAGIKVLDLTRVLASSFTTMILCDLGDAEIANLIAPRPFMVERGHDDGVAQNV